MSIQSLEKSRANKPEGLFVINDTDTLRSDKSWTLLASLGFAACVALISSIFFTRWEWSFLMDDVSYVQWMPKVTSLWSSMGDQIRDYFHAGRFYPFKYLVNLVKWRYLPLDPALFHWFNFGVLLTAVGIGAVVVVKQTRASRPRAILLFVAGLAVLQRPLLDVIALSTIGEGWAILFFAVGLLLYPKRGIAYRLALLFAALSKEPAIIAFAAAGLARICEPASSSIEKRTKWLNVAVDFGLFAIFVLILKRIQMQGTYLKTYSIFTVNTLRLFSIGLVKCLLGLLPLLVLFNPKKLILPNKLFWSNRSHWILCMAFGLGYLVLATARGVAGYLLIPVSFSIYLAASLFVISVLEDSVISQRRGIVFTVAFVAMLLLSLGRYERYCASINESTRAFHDLLLTSTPRLILINAEEAAALGQLLADEAHAPIKVVTYQSDPDAIARVHAFSGDVVLFELSTYMGHYSSATLQNLGQAMGGWKNIIDRKVCKIFYGQGHL